MREEKDRFRAHFSRKNLNYSYASLGIRWRRAGPRGRRRGPAEEAEASPREGGRERRDLQVEGRFFKCRDLYIPDVLGQTWEPSLLLRRRRIGKAAGGELAPGRRGAGSQELI